jgi:S-adenosylmethionine:tRNA ribosyltransferase-isomerase
MMPVLEFTLPPSLEAHEPPEARGLRRDQVRLLVGRRAGGAITVANRRFGDLPELLRAGDVLVVNTSATMPAALDLPDGLVLHVSTEQPDGSWVVELREPAGGGGKATRPHRGGLPGTVYRLAAGASVTLRHRYTSRFWLAELDVSPYPSVPAYLRRHGRPIRYAYVPREWPISAYQTVFGTELGSAEMPSASRPFTNQVVNRLLRRGVRLAPILLHTGVASAEADEPPCPERFSVSASTANLVNDARAAGGRIVAVGTTAVRALESAATSNGVVHSLAGWTDLVVTPTRGVYAVDGLITGLHEPRASHLLMLEAIAGAELLGACYAEAVRQRYLWHEFGDSNLLLAR